jgi:hypothetical protein
MNRELVKRLIPYIIDQLRGMEAHISTIRLVKFLYLIDLEYYNRHFKTLTGIDWIKYKYGPYFFEWGDVIRSAGLDLEIEEIDTDHGPGRTYSVPEEQKISDIVDFSTEQMVNTILKKWGPEDKDTILKFVYRTSPVEEANFREPLEFALETDHILIERAANTGLKVISLDDLVDDYEENHSNGK